MTTALVTSPTTPATASPTTTSSSTTTPPSTTPATATTAVSTTTTTTTTALPPTTTTTLPGWWRQPTPADPLRVWVIGDSLAPGVIRTLAARGTSSGWLVATGRAEGGTGLVRLGVFDWPRYAAEERPDPAPDVVVVVLGTNDGQALPEGWLEFASPEWDAAYATRVGAFMDQLAGFARRVYWVGAPTMGGPGFDAYMRHINRILRYQAALRLEVRYVDAYALFRGPDGRYAQELPDESGRLVRVRAEDGIHLSPAGADRLARLLMEIIDADWRRPAAAPD